MVLIISQKEKIKMIKEFIEDAYDFEIDTNLELNNYDTILNKFTDWIKFKREIKLLNLLESGKKLEFSIDIDSKYSPILGYLTKENDNISSYMPYQSITSICFSVRNMTFILNGNKIEKLKIQTKIINNESGNFLKNAIDYNMDFKIIEALDNDNNVCYFYTQFKSEETIS